MSSITSAYISKRMKMNHSESIQQIVPRSPPQILFKIKYDVSTNELSFSSKFQVNILIYSNNMASQRFLDLVILMNFLEFCKNCIFQGFITFL